MGLDQRGRVEQVEGRDEVSRHITLKFDLTDYADDDGETLLKAISFEGYGSDFNRTIHANMRFNVGVPNQREIELLTQLSKALDELAHLRD